MDDFIPAKKTLKTYTAKVKTESMNESLGIITQNKFQILTTATSMDLETTITEAYSCAQTSTTTANVSPTMSTSIQNVAVTKPKTKKPPPIILLTKVNYFDLRNQLKQLIKEEISAQYCPQGLKLFSANESDYNVIGHYLKSKCYEFYTFPYDQAKVNKVVLKGLPIDTGCEEIQKELISKKYAVASVKQMRRKKIDENSENIHWEPMPLWIVTTYVSPVSPDIHTLTGLFNLKLTIEDYKDKSGPLQCFKCQGFGHKAVACYVTPKCVKCARNHLTQDCDAGTIVTPKCANCNESHTANYKNCPKFIKYVQGVQSKRELNRAQTIPTSSQQDFPSLPRRHYHSDSQTGDTTTENETSSLISDLKELWEYFKNIKVYIRKFKVIMTKLRQEKNIMTKIETLFDGITEFFDAPE